MSHKSPRTHAQTYWHTSDRSTFSHTRVRQTSVRGSLINPSPEPTSLPQRNEYSSIASGLDAHANPPPQCQ